MARYVYRFSELWRESSEIVDTEIEHLEKWLHNSGVDPDFEKENHVHVRENGDRWFFLPEMTRSQQFAMTLVLTSSEIELDNKPLRFKEPPVEYIDSNWGQDHDKDSN